MAGKKKREGIKLKSTDPESTFIYHTQKNRTNTPGRIELKKYDPTVRKHVVFKETK